MNWIKLAVAVGTVLASAGAWAQPIDCAIFVNGQRLSATRSADNSTLLFHGENFEFSAEAENAERVKVTLKSEGREGYLIGAFRNGRLNMSPEINGRLVYVTCVQ